MPYIFSATLDIPSTRDLLLYSILFVAVIRVNFILMLKQDLLTFM